MPVYRTGPAHFLFNDTGRPVGIKEADGDEMLFPSSVTDVSGNVTGLVVDGSLIPLSRSFTWATLPAAVDYTGYAFVTDVGVHGSFWYSNGATWGVVGGSTILYMSAVAAAANTGSTSEVTPFTYILPAGLLGTDGGLEIITKHTYTNSANTKTIRHRLGGTAMNDPQFSSSASSGHVSTFIQARGSLNSQIGSNGAGPYTSNPNNFRTGTVDLSVNQNLTVSHQLQVGAESITLESVYIRLVRP